MRRLAILVMLSALPVSAAPQPSLPGGGFGSSVLPPLPQAAQYIHVTAVASHSQVTPGQTFHVAADIRVAKGWVYYSPNPGQRVLPAEIAVQAPGLQVGPVLWPPAAVHEVAAGNIQLVNNVYEGRAVAYVPVTVPADAQAGEYKVTLALKGQICSDVCLTMAGEIQSTAAVRVGPQAVVNSAWQDDPAFSEGLKTAKEALAQGPAQAAASPLQWTVVATNLAVALLAGLILNIMPCVLPVIPLRILSIVEMARDSRRRYVTLGLAFAGGILLFFVAIAGMNLILQLTVGRAWDWSEHYQIPAVRIALAMILVALAANLFGLFNVVVPSRIAGLGGEQKKQGHLASAGMGLMMAILATPCSFAILAGTLAWAQLQPLWLATLAFLVLGVGMAAPHAVLCAFPQLIQVLPKPGRWMELFKQTMGFLLLLAGVYLIGTLSADTYPAWVAGFGVTLVLALWMWGSWVRYDAPLRRKLILRGAAVAIAVASGWWMLKPASSLAVHFEPFEAAALAQARDEGRIVVVDFTASWCTACKVVEWRVYDDEGVAEELKKRNVLAMVADVTNENSPAAMYLKRQFNRPIPLSVVFPPGQAAPILLQGEIGKAEFLQAIEKAGK